MPPILPNILVLSRSDGSPVQRVTHVSQDELVGYSTRAMLALPLRQFVGYPATRYTLSYFELAIDLSKCLHSCLPGVLTIRSCTDGVSFTTREQSLFECFTGMLSTALQMSRTQRCVLASKHAWVRSDLVGDRSHVWAFFGFLGNITPNNLGKWG